MEKLLLEKFPELKKIDKKYLKAIAYLLEEVLEYSEEDINKIKSLVFSEKDKLLEIGNDVMYYILDDNEADEAVKTHITDTIDLEGLENVFSANFIDEIIYYCMDTSKLNDVIEEDIRSYIEDLIDSDGIRDSDAIRELIHYDIIPDVDELIDNYIEERIRETNAIDYLLNVYSKEEFLKTFAQYIDIDEVIERAIQWDGRGHFIASYDGKEIELPNGLFAYRV